MNSNDSGEPEVWPVPISALQHMSYCPRQCALIHLEHVFDDNLLTVRGKLAHKRVDRESVTEEDGIRIERGITLWSDSLGMTGKADVVEFHTGGAVVPVEYKHGKRHRKMHDDLQLCAQGMCLEEMLDIIVPSGAIYHYSSRRRRLVDFTKSLRTQVKETTSAVRALLRSGIMPPPQPDMYCRNCSLSDACAAEPVRSQKWGARWSALFAVGDDA